MVLEHLAAKAWANGMKKKRSLKASQHMPLQLKLLVPA